MTALQAPRRAPDQRPRRWGLRQVPIPQRRMASVPFILTLAVCLAVGMVGLLLLNTALQEQGFAVRDQQTAANQLGYRVAALEAEVTQARSSTRLAIKAGKLGMVPNPYPVYLSLPSGQVIGDPTKMTGSELPDVRYRTPEELAEIAKARAKAEAKRIADLAAAKKAAEQAREKAAKARAEAAAKKKAEAKQKAEAAARKKAAEEKKKGGSGR